jgi:hypothetical protein
MQEQKRPVDLLEQENINRFDSASKGGKRRRSRGGNGNRPEQKKNNNGNNRREKGKNGAPKNDKAE